MASRSKSTNKSPRASKRRGANVGVLAVARERVVTTLEHWRTAIAEAGLARWAETAGWAAVVIAVLVAWSVGVPRLEQSARAHAAVQTVEVVLLDPPTWLDAATIGRIEADAAADLIGDPFNADELRQVGRVVQATGWFEDVEQVRRVRDDRIEVTARPLLPVAFIRHAGHEWLIDAGGRRLPHERSMSDPPARRQPDGLASISGVSAAPPARPGEIWPGVEVRAALLLLEQLEAQEWRDQVAMIDASRFRHEGALDVITDRGARIRWGSPPGAEQPLEPDVGSKLEMLDTWRRRHPTQRIDHGTRDQYWFFDDALRSDRARG